MAIEEALLRYPPLPWREDSPGRFRSLCETGRLSRVEVGRVVESAPGKVNLWLSIKGPRPDGYHEIESLFQTVSLADRVEVEKREEPGIELSVREAPDVPGQARFGLAGPDLPGTPTGPENLAFRAAGAFLDRLGGGAGVAIRLEKALPVAAGLGGGSADAAAVLRALARLYPGALSQEELKELAAGLGADVPFLLAGGTAVGRGRGELVEALPALPEYPCVLLRPRVAVMTAEMYRRWDQHAVGRMRGTAFTPAGRSHRSGVGEFYRALQRGDLESASRLHRNDLRAVLPPAIAQVVGWWERTLWTVAGAPLVGMTGSGPTLFALFSTETEAARAHALLCEVASASGCPGTARWGVEVFATRLVSSERPTVKAGIRTGNEGKGERGCGRSFPPPD